MTENQQRAHELAQRIGVYDTDEILQALDAAEERGRAEVRHEIEKLANEYHAKGRRRIAFAEPAWPLDVARRLRALAAEATP